MKSGSLSRNGLISLLGGGFTAAANMVVAWLIGQELGPSGAGVFFQLLAGFAIASNIAELGADTGLVRFTSAALATGRTGDIRALLRIALPPVLLTGLVLILSSVVLSGWMSTFVKSPHLSGDAPAHVLKVLIFAVPVAATTMVLLGSVRALADVVAYSWVQNLIIPGGRLLLVAGALAFGLSLEQVMFAWLAPLAAALLVTVWLVRRYVHQHHLQERETTSTPIGVLRGQFWRFSASRGVAAAVEIALEWADVLIVAALCSASDAGIYAVATRCARIGELVQHAVRVAIGPRVSRLMALHQSHEVAELNTRVAQLMILLTWPAYGFVVVFSQPILGLFGIEFVAGSTALATLCVGMAIAGAAGSVQTILLMSGRSSSQLINKSITLALNVVLNFALIPHWGIWGAAVAWALSVVVDAGLATVQIWRQGVRSQVGLLTRTILCTVVVVGTSAIAAAMVFSPSSIGGLSVAFVAYGCVVTALLAMGARWLRLRFRLPGR